PAISLCPTRTALFPYTTLFRSGSDFGMEILPQNIGNRPQGPNALPPGAGEFIPTTLQGDDTAALWRNFLECVRAHNRDTWSTPEDRKSTRLNSSHQIISYAVFC